MIHNQHAIGSKKWKPCTCCGLKIRLLGNHQNLVLFMGASSTRRRGFQCINCGQIACFKCSANGCRSICRSNAWVALPYLESFELSPPAHADPVAAAFSE